MLRTDKPSWQSPCAFRQVILTVTVCLYIYICLLLFISEVFYRDLFCFSFVSSRILCDVVLREGICDVSLEDALQKTSLGWAYASNSRQVCTRIRTPSTESETHVFSTDVLLFPWILHGQFDAAKFHDQGCDARTGGSGSSESERPATGCKLWKSRLVSTGAASTFG